MPENNSVAVSPESNNHTGPFTVYSAGGLFTQDELAMNILIKEAVWRLSNGRFELFLPQSKEMQILDKPNVKAHIRNVDLLEIIKADIILVRFDGSELESGTVLEFGMAKSLGKPTVLLRSDFRRLNGEGLTEPYNLMVKNWPRTVEVHIDSYAVWAELFLKECRARGHSNTFQDMLKAELATIQKSVDKVARQIIAGMDAVLKLKSPYPPQHQEAVYRAFRFSPGSGFDQMLTADALDEIIQRLRKNGAL